MFETPEPYLQAEIAFRREQIQRQFHPAPRRRHRVRRRRTRFQRPSSTRVVTGGTVATT